MVTLLKDPFVESPSGCGGNCEGQTPSAADAQRGYDGYVEPDTKVPPKAKPVLAEISVNGVPIAEADILAEAQHHPAETPGEALIASAKALVVRELMLQEAQALAINPAPARDENARTETSEDALIRQLIEQEVKTPDSSSEERHRYYLKHQDAFCSDTIYEARHMLLASRTDEQTEENFELGKNLIRALQANKSEFSKLARAYSSCPSASEGGNLGQLTKGSTVVEFESVLEQMEAGQIWHEPVGSKFGFHIIYLVNKIPGKLLPFEMVEDKIGAWMEASSWSKAVAQYVGILVGRAKITGIQIDGEQSPLVQ